MGGDDIKEAAVISYVKAGFIRDILKTLYLYDDSCPAGNLLEGMLHFFVGKP
jgi:hypothetical protein